ncbi:unnamed protein product [Ranitomeya imitator]|uniref:Metalloendopeptidase n=1 Tax=Ranitomeya imitator TaxID=111125 RepID=A0ABN9MIS3_9NEOB|nr:unnamed protein product [Ranitomeya imitator]
MARRRLLPLLWWVFFQVQSAPLQLPALPGFQIPEPPLKSSTLSEDVFSTIERVNKARKSILNQGDIVVKDGRSAITCTTGNCFWPKEADGLVSVPYTLNSQFTKDDQADILKTMLEFSTMTCVRFVPRTREADYLSIISDIGCWSMLGRSGGPQYVSVDREGCMLHGVIQHELIHAIVFEHEHSRSDRDSYVKILWDNIVPGCNLSFQKTNTNNLGLEYDYTSVMPYGKFAFAINYFSPTIQPIPTAPINIGQRMGLSNLDVAKINRLYNCNVCSTLLSNDSGVFASASNSSNYPNNYNCSWLIRTINRKVQLTFSSSSLEASTPCVYDSLKIRDVFLFDGRCPLWLCLHPSCGFLWERPAPALTT